MGLSLLHLTFLRVHVKHVYGMSSPARLESLEGAVVVAGAIEMDLSIML
jgi:hypothetical protein